MKKVFTCIICPNGCNITAEIDGENIISILGNGCDKGMQYVKQELTVPKRTITSSILVENGIIPLASVRITDPIPKERIPDMMTYIRSIKVAAPVEAGFVIDPNALGLETKLIVTKSVPYERKQK